MAKSKKTKQPSLSELTPEQLKSLDGDTLVGIIQRLWGQNQQLSEMLRQIVREAHAPKTEHFESPEQLRLFDTNEAQQADSTTTAVSDNTEDTSSQSNTTRGKKKKGHQRNPMPATMDRKRITGQEPAECDLNCKRCSSKFKKIDEIVRNSRYECAPVSIFIEDFVAMIYECQGCGDYITVEPPSQTIENGTAGPTLVVEVSVARFVDHMPYNRQEERFARMGYHNHDYKAFDTWSPLRLANAAERRGNRCRLC